MELKVAVIGAGVSGLCAAKHFKACPDIAEVKVFECRDDIGGQWYYSPLTDEETPADDLHKQLYGVTQSSMYEELYLNTPSECVNFFDLKKRDFSRTYCHRREIFDYLKEYAQHFDLYRLISFNTAVTLVNPLSSEEFAVTTRDQQGREHTEVFNRVAVCKGNYSIPYIPDIEGISSFPGLVYHFKKFKQFKAQDFEGKTVVVVGASASGGDAIAFLLKACKSTTVVLSASPGPLKQLAINGTAALREEQRFIDKPRIKTISGPQIQFTDETVVTADEIILCTGYQLTFPFLPHQTVSEEGRYVDDLYKTMIDCKHPRIAHIGLLKGRITLRVELSVLYVLQQWLKTPDIEAMHLELKEDEQLCIESGKHLHSLYSTTWVIEKLFDMFSKLGVTVDPEIVARNLAYDRQYGGHLRNHYLTFKQLNLEPLT
jgi:trimethylamine monooxygenase